MSDDSKQHQNCQLCNNILVLLIRDGCIKIQIVVLKYSSINKENLKNDFFFFFKNIHQTQCKTQEGLDVCSLNLLDMEDRHFILN